MIFGFAQELNYAFKKKTLLLVTLRQYFSEVDKLFHSKESQTFEIKP